LAAARPLLAQSLQWLAALLDYEAPSAATTRADDPCRNSQIRADHPLVARALANTGLWLLQDGRTAEGGAAELRLREALRAARCSFGPPLFPEHAHASVASTQSDLGQLMALQGRRESLAVVESALSLLRRAHAPKDGPAAEEHARADGVRRRGSADGVGVRRSAPHQDVVRTEHVLEELRLIFGRANVGVSRGGGARRRGEGRSDQGPESGGETGARDAGARDAGARDAGARDAATLGDARDEKPLFSIRINVDGEPHDVPLRAEDDVAEVARAFAASKNLSAEQAAWIAKEAYKRRASALGKDALLYSYGGPPTKFEN
jgi:hypothetical protein